MKRRTGFLNEDVCLSFLNGYGDGYGRGKGIGNGDGYGCGLGIGNGNGDCFGNGIGCGNGIGIGNGNANGFGNGSGSDCGNGTTGGEGYGYSKEYGGEDGYGHGIGDRFGSLKYISINYPYYEVDGIYCAFLSIKGDYAKIFVLDIYNTDNCKVAYLAKDGSGNFAHGDTLREARESLIYKLTDRDTGLYKDWKLTDVKTKAELIQAYRVITGACEFGTRQFCESVRLPAKATVAKAIKLTKGQYGNETFAKFFVNENVIIR